MSQWNPPPHEGPGHGYGSYEPYGGHEPGAPRPLGTDGISIAAFVCSLTCCGAPLGIGLGIAGIVRTSGGRRPGRWMAISGVAIGTVVFVAFVAFIVFAGIMGANTVWEDEARVGQCIDEDFLGDPSKAECDEPHEAEVIWVGRFDDELVGRFGNVLVEEFCAALPGLDPAYLDAIESGEYDVSISIDSFDEDDPEERDWFFCYLEDADEDQLEGRILDEGTAA
ncbi:hypothetical protein ASE01_10240 [Nocardioides sp. Root190]|uniref:DUF4190 domain-containing protein n=1 Tax=Nocardioides sp. Root190 TaxID=1736488 RepID=UPI0006FA98A6|nr:DUF4190 domain-containing protein [Nocardioides sp. Root190]KRB77121.1 hypothetical protein ASE01_10240 [Nocardioides sp. Root190]